MYSPARLQRVALIPNISMLIVRWKCRVHNYVPLLFLSTHSHAKRQFKIRMCRSNEIAIRMRANRNGIALETICLHTHSSVNVYIRKKTVCSRRSRAQRTHSRSRLNAAIKLIIFIKSDHSDISPVKLCVNDVASSRQMAIKFMTAQF